MKIQKSHAQETTDYYQRMDILKRMSLPKEQWIKVNGGGGRYWISSAGRLATLNHYTKLSNRGKVAIMKPAKDANGYLRTMIIINGRPSTVKMHRMVAEHFIPNKKNKPQVNHLNHDKTDNRAVNLEWCTHRENIDHCVRAGRQSVNNGSKNGMAQLTEADVLNIKKMYKPYVVMAKDLAKEYGVQTCTIKDIVRGRTWKHVTLK